MAGGDQKVLLGRVADLAALVGEQRWVIAIFKKNKLLTTMPIASMLSSWHYQLK